MAQDDKHHDTSQQAEIEALRRKIDELSQALHRQRRLVASERQEREAAARDAKARLSHRGVRAAKREIASLERRLGHIYRSRTWRAGRALWWAYHLPGIVIEWVRDRVSRRDPPDLVESDEATDQPVPGVTSGVDYALFENRIVRARYEAATGRLAFSTSDPSRNIVMAVYTTDLDEGRGDIYTAVGLGRHLEMIGYEVVYVPRDRWYDLPRSTGYFVAMLETVDPASIPATVTTIAWVRNQTDSWVKHPGLPLYDLVLSSSSASLDLLRDVYPGPVGLLPIGVDPELFAMTARPEDRQGVVSTVNQWGREREVHGHLRTQEAQFPLALFGERRGMAPELVPFSRGPVSFFSLPSLYNQAAIVLDDFNHTTAGYGNVNSRVFEAVACGATVMTNRSVGLEELGLGDLAVYRSAAGLFDLIDRDLHSSDARKAATELRQTVLERHSYRTRATHFAGLLEDLAKTPRSGEDRLLVGFFPDYRENPYLEMMWSDLRRGSAIPIPVGNALDFAPLLRSSEGRPTVFHLNWTAPILGGGRDATERRSRYRSFLEALDGLQERGVPLIWTVHNVLPHECEDPGLEAELRQELADRADVVHVMCEETVRACAGRFEIPESKLRVLPHPSYIDVYPNLVDRDTARYELGLSPDDFLYLCFGKIRPYKGVDLLLNAFDRLSRHVPNAKLLLVGELGRFEDVDEIVQRAGANPNVVTNFNSIPDADVQLYMNATDVVVLPYRTALNSGALQLAYSFARPVIAPEVGCLSSQIEPTTGIGFSWEQGDQALLNAMLTARSLGPEHGTAAYKTAAEHHYLGIGREFAQLVADAIAKRKEEVGEGFPS